MNKGLRTTVTTLLAVICVTLGSSSIVVGSPDAEAQPMGGLGCPWDCQEFPDDAVDVPDLLALLGAWGGPQTFGTTCDIDGSGFIAVPDLLQLLGNWGVCP